MCRTPPLTVPLSSNRRPRTNHLMNMHEHSVVMVSLEFRWLKGGFSWVSWSGDPSAQLIWENRGFCVFGEIMARATGVRGPFLLILLEITIICTAQVNATLLCSFPFRKPRQSLRWALVVQHQICKEKERKKVCCKNYRLHCIFAFVQCRCCKRQLHTCCMAGVWNACLNLKLFC